MPSVAPRLLTTDEIVQLQTAELDNLVGLWEGLQADGVTDGELGRHDRFFLLTILLHRIDAWHPWLYARCREVEADPDGYLDLWAREHYKSTIITFAGVIQEIARNPNITIGIFSHVKAIARKFLAQIKMELEGNADLKAAYPEVFWENPHRDAPRWSLDGGIIVRRSENPKEATVEGHGLVDGMPTGAHFALLVYDDVVTLESVNTPEQVQKTTDAWALSDNLGARGLDGRLRKWHIGTRYSYADTYQYIIERKILTPRIYAATETGLADGEPVFLSAQAWADKIKTQPSRILAAQMLQNPAAGNESLFDKAWLRFADIRPLTVNAYILCDPASSQKKGSDNTAIGVVLVDSAMNKYLVDGVYHKMKLSERWKWIRDLRRKWAAAPGVQVLRVGYERYGSTSDLEYFEERMRDERDSFELVELAWPKTGEVTKFDRIQRLEPDFRAGKWNLTGKYDGPTKNQQRMADSGQAARILLPVRRMDSDKQAYALNKVLLDEYLVYPFAVHDDFLDMLSRIYDIDATPPVLIAQGDLEPEA